MRDLVMRYKWMVQPWTPGMIPMSKYSAADMLLEWQHGSYERGDKWKCPKTKCEAVIDVKMMTGKVKPLKQGWDARGSPVRVESYLHGGSTENDVVHCGRLPTFGESLSQEESERLMSFLTVRVWKKRRNS